MHHRVGVTESRSDYLSILSGTSQNIAGIAISSIATFETNLLISNNLGPS